MEEKPIKRYRFKVEKFLAALAYLIEKTGSMDKLKASKLLYFADKFHLMDSGRPIIGDCYHRLDYGPVPSMALDIMNDAIIGTPLRMPLPNIERFNQFFAVDDRGTYPKFILRGVKPDYRIFSKSEIDALDQTVKKYGRKTGPQLILLTHQEPAWELANSEIDYRLFVLGQPNEEEALALMELDEENREAIDLLRS